MFKIPNFPFGKVATCSVIHVFFLHMYCRNESPKVPSSDMELTYNKCLCSFILKHMLTMATHWPVSYSAALTLYHDIRSHIHPRSLNIPTHILDDFAHDYLNRLAELKPYFHDAYFVHKVHGWKSAMIHNPFNAADRKAAFLEFTHDLCTDQMDDDNWFIDTALEIGVAKHIVTWWTNGHKSLLQHCLPSEDNQAIEGLMNKQLFYQDRMMHLLDLSRFHCKTGLQGQKDEVKFIQAYMTEKKMAYQLHEGLFTEKSAHDLFSTAKLEMLVGDIKQISTILYDCTVDGHHG